MLIINSTLLSSFSENKVSRLHLKRHWASETTTPADRRPCCSSCWCLAVFSLFKVQPCCCCRTDNIHDSIPKCVSNGPEDSYFERSPENIMKGASTETQREGFLLGWSTNCNSGSHQVTYLVILFYIYSVWFCCLLLFLVFIITTITICTETLVAVLLIPDF